jgi:DNA polymerase V
MGVCGELRRELDIFDTDVLFLDKAFKARHGMSIIAIMCVEFTCKQLQSRNGRIKLKAANPNYTDIALNEGHEIEVWGMVRAGLNCVRRSSRRSRDRRSSDH